MGEMDRGQASVTVFTMHSIIELSTKIMLGGATTPERKAVMTAAAQEVVRLVQRLLVEYS